MIKHLKRLLPCLAMLTFSAVSCSSMLLEKDDSVDVELFNDEYTMSNSFSAVDKKINSYSVTWKNEKGEVLRIDSNVAEGTIPDYGCDPSYVVGDIGYKFVRWEPEPKEIYSNAYYTGIFVEEPAICRLEPHYNEKGRIDSYAVDGISYFYHETTLTIPSVYKGLPVTGINDGAFAGNKTLEYLVIPESIIYVGDGALNNMKKLRYVEFKADNVNFEEYVFAYSTKLTTVILPKHQKVLPRNTFSYCEELTTVDLPSSITTIDDYAFSHCSNLESITIPKSTTYIGTRAFYYDNKLRNVEFKSTNLTIIKPWAFFYCDLVEVNLPDGLETISERAFHYNQNLRRIRIPTSVTTIEDYAFASCGTISVGVIPSSIRYLSSSAFKATKVDIVNTNISSSQTFRINYFGDTSNVADGSDNEGLKSANVIGSSFESQAEFDQHKNHKIVMYKNYNGYALQYSYGDSTYNGITPSKPGDASYYYSFVSWEETYNEVTDVKEYVAQYLARSK